MAQSKEKDIEIEQGTSYTFIGTVQVLNHPELPYNSVTNPYIPFNFSGWDGKVEFRTQTTSSSAVFTGTVVSGGIQVNTPAIGQYTITVNPSDTNNIQFGSTDPWSGYWDVIFTNGGNSIKPHKGTVTIYRLVAR